MVAVGLIILPQHAIHLPLRSTSISEFNMQLKKLASGRKNSKFHPYVLQLHTALPLTTLETKMRPMLHQKLVVKPVHTSPPAPVT